jgi:hypothetical protein
MGVKRGYHEVMNFLYFWRSLYINHNRRLMRAREWGDTEAEKEKKPTYRNIS